MPVVTVLIPAHQDVGALLQKVADAVADAVALAAGDVIALHIASDVQAVSGGRTVASATWPIVSIHGSARDQAKMVAARDAAEAAVRTWCADVDVECKGVWTQWLTPLPQ